MTHDSILFKSVTLALPGEEKIGDLLVQNGKIAAIGPNLGAHASLIINEPHLTLMPGVLDPHVHFREPGATHKEDLYSGSKAAAAGGVTSFLDMPNNTPSATTRETIALKKELAAAASLINYGFFIGATTENLTELQKAEQVPGIKVFMGSSTGTLLVDQRKELEQIFATTPHLIAVHAEDEAIINHNKEKYQGHTDPITHTKIRTPEAALKSTHLAVELAKKHNKRLHICHLSTEEEALFLKNEKTGTHITTEVSPQHLLLYGEALYKKLGTFAQINPPLREDARHAQALWKALKNGTIDMIATDHAPHTWEEKSQPYPKAHSGMPGVETSLPLMLTLHNQGHCTLQEILKWMCENPAKVYNIPNKGRLEVGYDADLTLIDLKAKRTLTHKNQHTKCQWTAFDGWTVQGLPLATFVNGQLVYREGDFFEDIKGKALTFL